MTRCKHGQLQLGEKHDGYDHYFCRECHKTFKVKPY